MDVVAQDPPYSRDDLVAALEDMHREVGAYFAELPGDALFRHPEAGVWSPAENLVHLVKAVKAVADAMGRPRWLLAILFGTARGPSRPFEEMRRVYQERLARGGRAGGDDVDLRVARPPRPVLPTRRRPVTTTSSARSEPYRVSRASSSRSRSTNISTLQGRKR